MAAKKKHVELEVARSQDEIDDLLNVCSEHEDEGTSKFDGALYEQGVRAGILWVLGQQDENPMEE